MTLSEKLTLLREKRGLSRQELSDMSGVTYTYISKIENGERENVSLDKLEKLAISLKVDPRYFRDEDTYFPNDLMSDVPPEIQKVLINKENYPFVIAMSEAIEKGITIQQFKAALRIIAEVTNE